MSQQKTPSQFMKHVREEITKSMTPAGADAMVWLCRWGTGTFTVSLDFPANIPAKYRAIMLRVGVARALRDVVKSASVNLSLQQRHDIMERFRYMLEGKGR